MLFQIAKMLQNLANKPSYAKEAYMMTLNPFVENNKARINQFLNNLCEVGDFYDTLEVRCVLGSYLLYALKIQIDGSIHGTVEKRPHDSYHHERVVQYTFFDPPTYRNFSACSACRRLLP